jgi:hypothetical protein
MQLVGPLLPLAALALIAFLIVRSRVAPRSYGGTPRPWSFPRPKPVRPRRPPRPPATLIPFDRDKMDAELARILREKR